MTDTATHVRIEGVESAPAVWTERWLPDVDVFPELTQLREDHDRMQAQWKAEGAKVYEIKDRIEKDKEHRESALRDAYLAGESDPKVEDESEKLKVELEQAQERARAAGKAFVEHINVCITTIAEKRPEWLEQIESKEADIAAEAAGLEAQLREVQSQKGSFYTLYYWIDRTGGEAVETPAAHFPFADIPKPPANEQERERIGDQAMLESYAGSTHLATLISDEESLQREQDALAGEPDPEILEGLV
jgi:hypothetical protein